MWKFFKIKKTKRKLQRSRAFTLVESLVAIAIFTLAITAIMVVLGKGLSDINYVKKKVIATYLAQEGIEYIRNLRDTLVLYHNPSAQVGWDFFKSKIIPAPNTLCDSANGCYFNDNLVSYTDNTMPMFDLGFANCTSSTCANAPILYDGGTGKYGYALGSASGFWRVIKASHISANETKILSTVYWIQGSGTYSITFSESLFNWIE